MDKIKKIIELNIEIEGLLRVMDSRPTAEARKLLGDKFDEYSEIFYEAFPPFMDASDEVEEGAGELPEPEVVEEFYGGDVFLPNIIERRESGDGDYDASGEMPMLPPDDDGEYDPLSELPRPPFDDDDDDDDVLPPSPPYGDDDDDVLPRPPFGDDEQEGAPADEPETEAAPAALADVLAAKSEVKVDEAISHREAKNLSKAFTINDKFRFIQELFHFDTRLFANSIAEISHMQTFDEARAYFVDGMGMDPQSPAAKDFLAIIAKHF